MDFHCLSLFRRLEFVIGITTSSLCAEMFKKKSSRALIIVIIKSNQVICFSV